MLILALSGCGGSLAPGTPAAPAGTTSIAASAHRPLGAPGPSSAERSTEGISAIPAPISAIPAPISAIPAAGQTPPATMGAPCSLAQTAGLMSAGCHSLVRTDLPLLPPTTPAKLVYGMLPGWINQLYNLPPLSATAGANHTIGIVVAYDDPAAEADLAVYRNTFGLPACTTANGCFSKLSQNGGTNYPSFNAGWAIEAAADLDTVSAICPGCKLMLVEAASNNLPDLTAAVDFAATRGANVISLSWGVPEASDNVAYDSHFNHPGVAIVASAGDLGYGVMFPASSEHVIAVGGTSLYSSLGGISEVAWPHTASGCSAYIPKPAWQHDFLCPKRIMNDVAVDGDPATGMAVYDSVFNNSGGGWIVVGGTSIGAPIVSSIIALGPHPEHYAGAQQLYAQQNAFYNITYGSNGFCPVLYFCYAGLGYSGPAGIGAPNGDQAFDN